MASEEKILRIALPVKLRRLFDYKVEEGRAAPKLGSRVLVPLQKRFVVGIVCDVSDTSLLPDSKLRPIKKTLDSEAALTPELFDLLNWASRYYHHPIGEVMQAALPTKLRQDCAIEPVVPKHYRVRQEGLSALSQISARSHIQKRVIELLVNAGPDGLSARDIAEQVSSGASTALARLVKLGWTETCDPPVLPNVEARSSIELNCEQLESSSTIARSLGSYAPHLLEGVTGSGKTEVYLDCVKKVVADGKQALVLVPEISLTPQLVERFSANISGGLAVFHSGLTAFQRHQSWWRCRQGAASVILGTRSAIFAPFCRLGLIVVDEEHDLSYKQKEGFRYSARDVAVKRAQMAKIPIVLGSATPSLESLANAATGRYQHLRLSTRPGGSQMPRVAVVDVNHQSINEGLSAAVVEALKDRLAKKEQSIVFVNRRGFAPVVSCSACGWQAMCQRCDARLTLHRRSQKLICHHCGSQSRSPEACPECTSSDLFFSGDGTQRVQEALAQIFPEARVDRLDSDITASPHRLTEILTAVNERQIDILVGTQMLSKGHDFEGVTLVCVLSADQNLYSVDFRGPERLFQQLIQVSGRAGRRKRRGDVLIQTAHPNSEVFSRVVQHDFDGFARTILTERQQAGYPPFARFALLRAESPKPQAPISFLRRALSVSRTVAEIESVEVFDPIPSPMERRAGRFRAQLLMKSVNEKAFHLFLDEWIAILESLPESSRVRWSVDIDPQDMY